MTNSAYDAHNGPVFTDLKTLCSIHDMVALFVIMTIYLIYMFRFNHEMYRIQIRFHDLSPIYFLRMPLVEISQDIGVLNCFVTFSNCRPRRNCTYKPAPIAMEREISWA